MLKFLKYVLFPLAVILVCLYCMIRFEDLDIFGLFKDEGLTIEKTENVITEVKRISKFTTACYYEEITLVKTKPNKVVDNVLGEFLQSAFGQDRPLVTDELCIIMNGKVRAGYDLSQIEQNALTVAGDTLKVKLPQPQIFEVIVNNTDCDVFVSDGNWEHSEVISVQKEAKARISRDAEKAGILQKARKSGEAQLITLFKSFGFKEVVLQ